MSLRIILILCGVLACTAGARADQPPLAPATGASQPASSEAGAAGEVVRAVFTSAVTDREPVDSILTLGNDESHVYCFTELRGFAGRHVTHRWEYEGQLMAEVGFDVGGWRWRVWSRKNLRPEWRGQWRVSVLDEDGRVLLTRDLIYEPATALAPDTATVTAANP